jgi:hypothetical protein
MHLQARAGGSPEPEAFVSPRGSHHPQDEQQSRLLPGAAAAMPSPGAAGWPAGLHPDERPQDGPDSAAEQSFISRRNSLHSLGPGAWAWSGNQRHSWSDLGAFHHEVPLYESSFRARLAVGGHERRFSSQPHYPPSASQGNFFASQPTLASQMTAGNGSVGSGNFFSRPIFDSWLIDVDVLRSAVIHFTVYLVGIGFCGKYMYQAPWASQSSVSM